MALILLVILFLGLIVPHLAGRIASQMHVQNHYPSMSLKFVKMEYSSAHGDYFAVFQDKSGNVYNFLMTPKFMPVVVLYDPINPAFSEQPLLEPDEVAHQTPSPFTQFDVLECDETGFPGEQVEKLFQAYGIYEEIQGIITKTGYEDFTHCHIHINGFSVGDKKGAIILLNKGNLFIYVMFSGEDGQWKVDGYTYHDERYEPEYRIEKSYDDSEYWLVVKYEANHGMGSSLINEVWYNPDGSIAAQFPIEGYSVFLPDNIQTGASIYFTGTSYYHGGSLISLHYSVSLEYEYKEGYRSTYSLVPNENWEYDLQSHQFRFVSAYPHLPDYMGTVEHVASDDHGIMHGYIEFYKEQIGDKKITHLEEWESFLECR